MKSNSSPLLSFSSFVYRFLFFLLFTACATPAPLNTPTPFSTATSTSPSLKQPAPNPTATPTPPAGDVARIRFEAPDLVHGLAWSADGGRLAVAAGTELHIYAADG